MESTQALQEIKVDENRDLNKEQRKCRHVTSAAADILDDVKKTIDTLDLIDRAYFGKDKLKILRAKIEEAILMLD